MYCITDVETFSELEVSIHKPELAPSSVKATVAEKEHSLPRGSDLRDCERDEELKKTQTLV